MIESLTNQELLIPATIALSWLLAFSRQIRQEILRRDNRTCQGCGKRERDGWKLDAAHFDHDYSHDHYNHPDNGRCLCLQCHADEALQNEDMSAYYLIQARIARGDRYF